MTEKVFAYVGANTTPARGGKAKGIRVFEIAEDGEWKLVQETDDINPGFLALSKDKHFLYCTHANHTTVSAYNIDSMTGQLTLINRQPIGGYNGTHLSLTNDERYLMVAAASSGTIAVFPINPDHSIGAVCDSLIPAGELGPLRLTEQQTSMPHQIIMDPYGKYIFSPDRGEEMIHTFSLDNDTGQLTQINSLRTRSARTPRHMVFAKNLHKAYILTEFSSTVVCCDWDVEDGSLSPFQIIPALPETFVGLFNKGAEIEIRPDERYLYVSNRGHNSIAIYKINQKTGWLTSVGWQNSYGDVPRFFTFEPGAKYLYVANEKSDCIISFIVDRESGLLTATGQIIHTPTPTCILFSDPVKHIKITKNPELKEVYGEYKVFSYPQK